jgi:hypothetical protein
METNHIPTPLCNLAYKYGTDKCPQIKHTYTPYYYELWKAQRNKIKEVLELGIGPYKGRNPHLYSTGASLYMWRDFFPNAQIYGADIKASYLLADDRIQTFLCDETQEQDLINLIKSTGNDIDIFIDDGSHELADQIFCCQTLMPLLKKDITYVIEDVVYSKKLISALSNYKCYVPEIGGRNANNQLVKVTYNNLPNTS